MFTLSGDSSAKIRICSFHAIHHSREGMIIITIYIFFLSFATLSHGLIGSVYILHLDHILNLNQNC